MGSKTVKYVIAVLLYGTIGFILHFVENVPSSIVVMCRAIIGTIFIGMYILLSRNKVDWKTIKKNLLWIAISGISLGSNWIFLFEAYTCTSVAIASLCNYMAPIFVLALSPFLFKEKIGLKKILCVVAAVIGIVLVSGVITGDPADMNPKGMGLGLLSSLGFVFLLICNKKIKDIGPYDKTLSQLFFAAATVTPYAILTNLKTFHISEVGAVSIILVLVLGIVHTGIAYILYFDSIGAIPVATVAVLGYLEPVLSILLSAFALREATGWFVWIGAVLIIGAAVVSEVTGKKLGSK